jgi:hypothetical protein
VSDPAGHAISHASHPTGFDRGIQLRSAPTGSSSEGYAVAAKAAAQRSIAAVVRVEGGAGSASTGVLVIVDKAVIGISKECVVRATPNRSCCGVEARK